MIVLYANGLFIVKMCLLNMLSNFCSDLSVFIIVNRLQANKDDFSYPFESNSRSVATYYYSR